MLNACGPKMNLLVISHIIEIRNKTLMNQVLQRRIQWKFANGQPDGISNSYPILMKNEHF